MTHIAVRLSYPVGLHGDRMMSVVGLPVRHFAVCGADCENVFATHYSKAPNSIIWKRLTP